MKTLKHKDLIKFLQNFDDYNSVKIVEKERNVSDLTSIDTNDINKSVHLIGSFFNQPTGSAGNFNLYKLLQVYLKNEDKRIEINKILKNY